MAEKNYRSFTGITGFHYKVLDGNSSAKKVERIRGLKEITVSKEQSIERAHGDNGVMETATTNGVVEVESTFHHLPLEDRVEIFGLEKLESGVVGVGENSSPYVAILFEKTFEDGARETVALLKGMFTLPENSGATKESGSVEFAEDTSSGEFIPVEVAGFEKRTAYIFGYDEAGSNKRYNEIYKLVFGEEPEGITP